MRASACCADPAAAPPRRSNDNTGETRCSRPRSPAACRSPPGWPRPESCGRVAAERRRARDREGRRDAALDQAAGGCRPRHRRRRRAGAPALRARLPGAGRRHRLRAQGRRWASATTATTRWCRRWSAPLRLPAACTRCEAQLARAHTKRKLKFTLARPDDDRRHRGRPPLRRRPRRAHRMAFAFADLLNQEAHALVGRRRRHHPVRRAGLQRLHGRRGRLGRRGARARRARA